MNIKLCASKTSHNLLYQLRIWQFSFTKASGFFLNSLKIFSVKCLFCFALTSPLTFDLILLPCILTLYIHHYLCLMTCSSFFIFVYFIYFLYVFYCIVNTRVKEVQSISKVNLLHICSPEVTSNTQISKEFFFSDSEDKFTWKLIFYQDFSVFHKK